MRPPFHRTSKPIPPSSPFAPVFAHEASSTRQAPADRIAHAWAALDAVPDPEIPVVSIRDLGILRDVTLADDGITLDAVITPTYSGCPAMSQIAEDVGRALEAAGLAPWRVRTVLAPAWTTDWITEAGRANLRAYGIAPPGRCVAPAGQHAGHRGDDSEYVEGGDHGDRGTTGPRAHNAGKHAARAQPLRFVPRATRPGPSADPVACPHCGSTHTEELSRFASTACKALHRCLDCREPFDYFKPY